MSVATTSTVDLQKALLNSLIGNHDSKYMPSYLGTFDSNNAVISNNIVFTARHIEGNDSDGYKAVFTATLTSANKGSGISKLKMLALDKTTELASIEWNQIPDYATLSSSLNENREVVFTWEITLPLVATTQESESE